MALGLFTCLTKIYKGKNWVADGICSIKNEQMLITKMLNFIQMKKLVNLLVAKLRNCYVS